MKDSVAEVMRLKVCSYVEAHGYTIRSFAQELGIPPTTMYRYISGENSIPVGTIAKISGIMGVSVDWLFGLTETRGGNLPEETRELFDLYSLASKDDKMIVDTILKKYKV